MLKKILLFPILLSLTLPGTVFSASPMLDNLQKMLPGVEIGPPQETQLKGIYLVRIGSRYAYVSADGNYALIGNLIDLKKGLNLTEIVQANDNVPILKSFPAKSMIFFPAEGKEKSFITVFTDTSCPYCRKLHKEIPALQQAGITVRYLPYPRGLKKGSGYNEMKTVWCADDRVKAMNVANGVSKEKVVKNDCAIDDVLKGGYAAGNRLGVTGTPAIFLPDGRKIGGYTPAKNIIRQLFPTVK